MRPPSSRILRNWRSGIWSRSKFNLARVSKNWHCFCVKMVKELTPDEFTDRLLPIFRDVESRVSYPGGDFNPEHFFSTWQNLMRLKVARTWEQGPGDAVLGAIFSPNLFVKNPNALVSFWFKKIGAPSALPVMEACIVAAREAGCSLIYSAAYGGLSPTTTETRYRGLGFEQSEIIFRKRL